MFKVAVIDDEYLVRERIKYALDWSYYGFELCWEASNGEDALDLMEKTCPDLALVDINMPIMDGLEFADKAASRYPNMRVVILTGYGSFDYAKKAIHAGVNEYLLKPLDSNELAETLVKIKAGLEKEKAGRYNLQKLIVESREKDAILKRKLIQSLLENDKMPEASDSYKLNELFGECITKKRMQKAMELLDLGTDKINEIAELVGYSDPYYFSKCFKKHTGLPVSVYIKARQKQNN
jgi:YesN/AraC family two-component response regulator